MADNEDTFCKLLIFCGFVIIISILREFFDKVTVMRSFTSTFNIWFLLYNRN